MNPFIETITASDPQKRDRSFFEFCESLSTNDLILYLEELEVFRKSSSNLYERVRASIFLYAGFRFVLTDSDNINVSGNIPPDAYYNILNRNFEKSITQLWNEAGREGLNSNLTSAFAEAYHKLAFQALSDQVKKSVRLNKGNRWMFRVGHPDEHPLQIHQSLYAKSGGFSLFPILHERTPVRLDLTHSCWSDIFFLGMDFPEGARVINISVDLGVYGRDNEIKPPVETFFRIINEPVIRLTSLDLKDTKDVAQISDLFNFANDYIGLLKAAVIASGVIPPSFEGTSYSLEQILSRLVGPGMGIELVTKVNDIPKGSRLAVSTNLLASMISVLMRATGQTESVEGMLNENERRIVASRAILGEWLGGSGGGWQDSGGIWPGVKTIEGLIAGQKDPEFNVSRGCLLPKHKLLGDEINSEFEEKISSSLVLMHGGMASNVGPILELVTEKYLLRLGKEWDARKKANKIYDEIYGAVKKADVRKLSDLTSENFDGPIKSIIPWATNHFTETVINKVKEEFGKDYLGFLMLGGISGGGMGMFFNPKINKKAKEKLLGILQQTKDEMSSFMPFAMNPVVYDFQINKNGSFARVLKGKDALMPQGYYSFIIPILVGKDTGSIPDIRKIEFDMFTARDSVQNDTHMFLRSIVGSLFKFSSAVETEDKNVQNELTEKIKKDNGFDYIQHEQIRQDLIKGRIGLSRNRLPAETEIKDVEDGDIYFLKNLTDKNNLGSKQISEGKAGVLCLAAGSGSRWTSGAGVIKAVNPFADFKGRHRSFIEIHLAKNRKTGAIFNTSIPFAISTSYLSHEPIAKVLDTTSNFAYEGKVYLSPGKSIGQRFVPMERDLRFLWEDMPQEILDENKQKVRNALRETLIQWAKSKGEGSDYSDNISFQRLSPLGHWFELPNMLRNGTLKKMLLDNPGLENLMLHNVDTLGANLSPEILNYHINSGNALTFELIPRRIEDRGGGLAKINGKIRILEGLAQPREEDELALRFYNSMTTWINIDKFLDIFGLSRDDLSTRSESEITEAIRNVARKLPSYVTIKDVKYRWGNGQEDILPVAQIEKLWSDMSGSADVQCGYLIVPRLRGQQLKDPAQLDAWMNDGSKEYIESICDFGN